MGGPVAREVAVVLPPDQAVEVLGRPHDVEVPVRVDVGRGEKRGPVAGVDRVLEPGGAVAEPVLPPAQAGAVETRRDHEVEVAVRVDVAGRDRGGAVGRGRQGRAVGERHVARARDGDEDEKERTGRDAGTHDRSPPRTVHAHEGTGRRDAKPCRDATTSCLIATGTQPAVPRGGPGVTARLGRDRGIPAA